MIGLPETIKLIEKDIEFEIYDSKGNFVKSIKTNEQGFTSTNLVYGNYTVKQKNTTFGYEKVKDFKIVINSLYKLLSLLNTYFFVYSYMI